METIEKERAEVESLEREAKRDEKQKENVVSKREIL